METINNEEGHVEPRIVVAIGASAGGLEALRELLEFIPDKLPMAIAIVQHLSPNHKSLMDDLLSRITVMKVKKVEQSLPIEAGTVYLNTPGTFLLATKVGLYNRPFQAVMDKRNPIDEFFTSIANCHGAKAIGVILSGTGTDGTAGCQNIKNAGGTIIVQDPDTAKFDGMPHSVLDHNLADAILSPREIAQTLTEFAKADSDTSLVRSFPVISKIDYSRIVQLLKGVSQIDFNEYRSSTILRRIEKRLNECGMEQVADYIAKLEKEPEELARLHNDMLIGVTQFFRDPEIFISLLEKVIYPLIGNHKETQIRVWVAGCATGEEAYTMGILFADTMEKLGVTRDVKILATDVDFNSLAKAKAGLYPVGSLESLPEEFRDKYFKIDGNQALVNSSIRNMIQFLTHNVHSDPPFTRIDLVSCRNLLIYFEPEAQLDILSFLCYGLKGNGALLLGPSETLSHFKQYFKEVHDIKNCFIKVRETSLDVTKLPRFKKKPSYTKNSEEDNYYKDLTLKPQTNLDMPHKSRFYEVIDGLLQTLKIPCLIVDSNSLDIVYTSGTGNDFIRISTGRVSLNISSLVDNQLSTTIIAAIANSIERMKPVSYKDIKLNKSNQLVDISVEPLNPNDPHQGLFVVFIAMKAIGETKFADAEVFDFSENIRYLEQELAVSKRVLQSTVEDLETTNEELQSTNEELTSSNEELQSTNEELQSLNEELHSINSEYQQKIDELIEANKDIEYLLRCSDLGILFLDPQLKVRRFNSTAGIAIELMPHDIGKNISELIYDSSHDVLYESLERVVSTGQPMSTTFKNFQGVAVVAQLFPYKFNNSEKVGVVVTFNPDGKSSNDQLEQNRKIKALKRFNYDISHELQGINREISMIVSSGELDKVLLAEKTELLTSMIDALLRISRIHTSTDQLEKIDPNIIIKRVIKNQISAIEKKGLNIDYNSNPFLLEVDPIQFEIIMSELLKNAIEFSDTKKGKTIQIEIEAYERIFLFRVINSGKGIMASESRKIFRPFYRIGKQPEIGHLGIGLSLAEAIVERHGGKISAQGLGTDKFEVNFSIVKGL